MNFSVLIPVYHGDYYKHFKEALDSVIINQTIRPSEVVIVVDGPVPDEINSVLNDIVSSCPVFVHVIRFGENKGLGAALQKGVEAATNEIIMRMDSDDIAEPDRFEKQLRFMEDNPNVVVCGGQIDEFINHEANVVGRRVVPCSNGDIRKYMKSRCGFNHMTVALRRSKVLEVGNYQTWFWNEDYYLWIRLMIAGYKFANLPDVLVSVRVGKDMYARRGGIRYFKSEVKLQRFMWSNGVIDSPLFIFNVLARLCIQVLMPNKLRGFLFQRLFRKRKLLNLYY